MIRFFYVTAIAAGSVIALSGATAITDNPNSQPGIRKDARPPLIPRNGNRLSRRYFPPGRSCSDATFEVRFKDGEALVTLRPSEAISGQVDDNGFALVVGSEPCRFAVGIAPLR
jgi:hypothetical protein